jgi:hypothetical protein
MLRFRAKHFAEDFFRGLDCPESAKEIHRAEAMNLGCREAASYTSHFSAGFQSREHIQGKTS